MMKYEEILIKLRKIIRSINLESKRIEKEYGISIPQLLILQHLLDQKDYKATFKQLKTYINLNASTVTGIVKRLESKELVTKKISDSDRRVTYVILTAKGLKLIESSPTTLQEKVTARLQALPEQELIALNEAIETLTQIMGAEKVEAAPILTSAPISKK